jgi:HSP20 family protein
MLIPSVDIAEHDRGYEMSVELPGVRREDLAVEVHEHLLTLRGEERASAPNGAEAPLGGFRAERSVGHFVRSFSLPPNVDLERIEAGYSNGILRILIPKSVQPPPLAIHVETR